MDDWVVELTLKH